MNLPGWEKSLRAKRKQNRSPEEYVEFIKQKNRIVLSQAITIVESRQEQNKIIAESILQKCLEHKKPNTIRIGITGVPGVGKSTFIDSFGMHLISQGLKVAVLAVDPTSSFSKGSILGDKTRMIRLANEENAYIRPSPAGDSLGGVTRKTRESIILCETYGFDVIIVETVGVGQSETVVHSMVDFFLLLLLIDSGDELQGIKRGIMEMADIAVITKADVNLEAAELAATKFQSTLNMFPNKTGWNPKVLTSSATKNEGIDTTWNIIQEYKSSMENNGYFLHKRGMQEIKWFHELINADLKDHFFQNSQIKAQLIHFENKVKQQKILATKAAKELLKIYYSA